MTITYSLEVSKVRVGGFLKLLLRWKGSIYRLMYREMCIFIVLYYSIAVLYRYLLAESGRRVFEQISWYMKDFMDLVPITFVLGFYVSFVVGRWWQQFLAIPWVDRVGLQVAAYVQGSDEKGRLMRRAMVRYLNLMFVLTFQATSTVVKKRFPTIDHLEDSGLLTMEERVALDEVIAPHGNWWVPAAWFAQLAMEARKEGRIHDDLHLKSIIDEMLTFRGACGMVWSYDWISVPLVYTQVVTISVYSFFAACLLGRQYLYQIPQFDAHTANYIEAVNATSSTTSGESSLNAAQYVIDYYIPIFTLFQFFFYMGWLKVAEEMICPYGEDDDDFELNWIIDRNIQVGYLMVDKLQTHPKLVRDLHWDEADPEVPYTTASASTKPKGPFLGSTMAMNLHPQTMHWENDHDHEHPVLRRRKRHSEDQDPEDMSPPLRPKFLKGLIPGNSRLSLNHGSKNSLTSGFDSIRAINGGVRSPSFFSRQRSMMSTISNHVFHRQNRPSFSISRAGSRQGSLAGDLATHPHIYSSTNLVADRVEDFYGKEATSPGTGGFYDSSGQEQRSEGRKSQSMETVAEMSETEGTPRKLSSASSFVPDTQADDAKQSLTPEDLMVALSDAPVAVYDNPGQSLLDGVSIMEEVKEEPEEDEKKEAGDEVLTSVAGERGRVGDVEETGKVGTIAKARLSDEFQEAV